MIEMFEEKIESALPFLELVKGQPTVFILDRGFARFEKWILDKQKKNAEFYPNLILKIPVNKLDKTKRYSS